MEESKKTNYKVISLVVTIVISGGSIFFGIKYTTLEVWEQVVFNTIILLSGFLVTFLLYLRDSLDKNIKIINELHVNALLLKDDQRSIL